MKYRRSLWTFLTLVALFLLSWQSRTVWLPWIAKILVIEDHLRPADVIAVFATKKERTEHAAGLYRAGLAPRILVTGELTSKGTELFCGRRITGAELSAKVLTDLGVPKKAVIVIARGTSTFEEAEAIKNYMDTHRYGGVIAVSSAYHMRRVKATLGHVLKTTGITAQYSPAKDRDFNTADWWQHERSLIHVTNEYLKLIYYHLALF